MAPVADTTKTHSDGIQRLKANSEKVFNPFYSPSIGDDGDDGYEYSRYKVSVSPVVSTLMKR